ncbi:hypothetical protein GCM10020331_084330 [Ectobacillus funiculus]
MGYITDNFHKTKLGRRFGRRKFFILAAIPLVLVYTLIWVDGFGYWYYLLTYIIFELVYSMVLIPYDTLAAEMSNDYKIRSKIYWRKNVYRSGFCCICCIYSWTSCRNSR